jgi:hypothetical protein
MSLGNHPRPAKCADLEMGATHTRYEIMQTLYQVSDRMFLYQCWVPHPWNSIIVPWVGNHEITRSRY